MKHHRKFNFIFFIDQGPTRTWTLDSRYFIAVMSLIAVSITTLFGLLGLSYFQSRTINTMELLLKENKEILFSYKVRVDDIYSKYYAQTSFNSKQKSTSTQPAKSGDSLSTSRVELTEEKIELPTSVEAISVAPSTRLPNVVSSNDKFPPNVVDFDSVKVLATSESLQANFLIKNLTPNRLEGRFTIVAEFLDDSGSSHYVAHPERTSLSKEGVPKQLENGTLFSIQRFKPTVVSVERPNGLGGKFTKATLYATAGGTTVKDEVIIDASVSGVLSKQDTSTRDETH